MRYIKTYEGIFDFLKKKKVDKSPEENQKEIIEKYLKGTEYKINPDMSVDVFGDVIKSETHRLSSEITDFSLKEFPIKFNIVNGDFNFAKTKLRSLRLGPKKVTGDFECSYNYLTSLKGSPEYVGGNYSVRSIGHLYSSEYCLRTLEGCPKYVGGYIDFSGYGVYTFEFFPDILGGDVICKDNPIYYIWKLFQDKNMIEAFNAYDCIRPPEVEGDIFKYKPILYVDFLEIFLDELDKITNKGIIEDLDMNAMEYSQKIMMFYDVRLSSDDKTIKDRKPLVRLYMKRAGTLPDRVFDQELGKWKVLDPKTGEWKISLNQN